MRVEVVGSRARALTRRATALRAALVAEDPAYAVTLRNVVMRMVAIDHGQIVRRRVARQELVYDDPDENHRVDDVLWRMHEAQLITIEVATAEDGATSSVEPIDDELLRSWPQVKTWLDELDTPVGTGAMIGAVRSAAGAWQAASQARSLLWTDARVAWADALRRDRAQVFNAGEVRFIRDSVRRRRQRRIGMLGGVIAAVLAIAVGLGAWQQGLGAVSGKPFAQALVRN